MQTKIQLIVGLGNPGPEYVRTRHNAGEWLVEALAARFSGNLREESKFFGRCGRIRLNGEDTRLLIPTTFMNRSGQAVAAVAKFYQIPPEEILVAHDEMDFGPGMAKFKRGGGHGGHNGLRDIISRLGNNKDFLRCRIGIGHPGDKNRVTGYVLGKAPTQEQQWLDAAVDEAARCIELIGEQGLAKATARLHTFKANS